MPTREPSRIRRLKKIAGPAGFVLLLTAVWQELRKPADAREWHGQVRGVVPYDLRPPSWSRFRSSLWDPGVQSPVPATVVRRRLEREPGSGEGPAART